MPRILLLMMTILLAILLATACADLSTTDSTGSPDMGLAGSAAPPLGPDSYAPEEDMPFSGEHAPIAAADIGVNAEALTITSNNSCRHNTTCNSGQPTSVSSWPVKQAVEALYLKKKNTSRFFCKVQDGQTDRCYRVGGTDYYRIEGCSNIAYLFAGHWYNRACRIERRNASNDADFGYEARVIYGEQDKYALFFEAGSGAATQEGRQPNNVLYSPPPAQPAPSQGCHMDLFNAGPFGCNFDGGVDVGNNLCVKQVCG